MELGAESATERADQRALVAVLSADELLLGALRNAVPGLTFVDAASVGDLARLLGSQRCRALCVDLALVGRTWTDLLPRLASLFPELPIVVIAAREDEPAVEEMLQRGVVERFLVKPVSAHRARILLTDAARQGYANIVGPAPGLAPAPPPPPTRTPQDLASLAELDRPARTDAPLARPFAGKLSTPAAAAAGAAVALVAAAAVYLAQRPAPPPVSPASGSNRPATAVAPEVGTLLAAGDLALARGALVAPIGSSAMDYYRRAIYLDPGSRAARTGLAATAQALLREADTALQAGRYAEAETAARAAGLAVPDEPRVAAMVASIQEAQRAAVQPSRGTQAANRVAQAANGSAPAVNRPGPTAQRAGDTRAGAGTGTSASAAGLQASLPARTALPPAAPEAPGAAAAPLPEAAPAALTAPTTAGDADAAASPLRRIAGAEPRYPRRARADGVTGWVDLEFTVSSAGVPEDIRIVGARPEGVFDSPARSAVSTWRYAPPGAPRRAGVRLRFDLADD